MRHPLRRTVLVLCGIGVIAIACGVYLLYTPNGCALLSAIPYCNRYALELQKLEPALGEFFFPILSWVGVFVREHLSWFAGGYALIALFMFSRGLKHWHAWELFKPFFMTSVIFGVWCFGGLWASTVFRAIHNPTDNGLLVGSIGFLRTIAGLCTALLTIALGITFWVGVPLYLLFSVLFLLVYAPGAVLALLHFTVRAPLLLWHYLHYLFVPHPAEMAYKAGMAKHVPLPELARTVAGVMYTYDLKDYEGLPKAWKSKNWKKRLDALNERLHAEDKFMEELIRNLRLKDQLRE